MASTASITSRRGLLRAASTATAYAAGVVVITGGAAFAIPAQAQSVDRCEWDRAFAAYQVARRAYADGAHDRDREDRLSKCEVEAWRELFMLPAPDSEACMFKMDYLFDSPDDDFCDAWSMKIINVLKADVRRLAA